MSQYQNLLLKMIDYYIPSQKMNPEILDQCLPAVSTNELFYKPLYESSSPYIKLRGVGTMFFFFILFCHYHFNLQLILHKKNAFVSFSGLNSKAGSMAILNRPQPVSDVLQFCF